jgi:signal transduction histidine kinase
MESLRERARRAEADRDREVAEAKAAERDRIAREMHDVLAHRLSLLATYAGALEYRPDTSPEKLSRAAAVIRDSAHQALVELREVITLMPGEARGLADLQELLDESRAVGADVEFVDRRATTDGVPDAIARAAYRVVQEAVTNARRHAPGQRIRVDLDGVRGEHLTVEIRNSVTTSSGNGGGRGLIGLAERIDLVGGDFEHGRSRGEFHVRARLPWPA